MGTSHLAVTTYRSMMETAVRNNQLYFKTETTCGKVWPNPSRAVLHQSKCKICRKPLVLDNPPGLEAPSLSDPSYTPPTAELSCMALCVDRGAHFNTTPCLCDCHYVGTTSRRMIKEEAKVETRGSREG